MATYRSIEGHPGYRVGDDGSVWSSLRGSWKLLKPDISRYGYPTIWLSGGKRKRLSRLVLETFIGPCPDGMEACHYPDPDRTNCRLSNLRWGTHEQNAADKREHGTQLGGERNPASKLTNAQVAEIKALRGKKTQVEIAAEFGVCRATVSSIMLGKSRTECSHSGRGRESVQLIRRILSPDDVREIRRLCAAGHIQRHVAKQFRTSPATVSEILSGKIWGSVI